MTDVQRNMEQRLKVAKQGYRTFQQLRKAWPADHYVLFRDKCLTRTAVNYFDFYTDRFPKGTKFALLFLDMEQLAYGAEKIKTAVRKRIAPQELQQQLIDAYALCDLSKFLTVVSLTEPYDTGAWRLYGKSRVGLEELVCFDIYGLDQVPQKCTNGAMR